MEKEAAGEPSSKKTKRAVDAAAENSISRTSSGSGSSNGGQETNEEDWVHIKVIGQDNKEVAFRVSPETKLQRSFHLYCINTGQVHDNVRFIYKGKRIYGFHTPKALKMKKNKTIIINAMTYAHGGGSSLQN